MAIHLLPCPLTRGQWLGADQLVVGNDRSDGSRVLFVSNRRSPDMAIIIIHMASLVYSVLDALISNSAVDINASDLAKIGVLVVEAVLRHREQKKVRKVDAPKS
jgi:hypothetical protein